MDNEGKPDPTGGMAEPPTKKIKVEKQEDEGHDYLPEHLMATTTTVSLIPLVVLESGRTLQSPHSHLDVLDLGAYETINPDNAASPQQLGLDTVDDDDDLSSDESSIKSESPPPTNNAVGIPKTSDNSDNLESDSDGSNGPPDEASTSDADTIDRSDSGSDTDPMDLGHSESPSDSDMTENEEEYVNRVFDLNQIEEGQLESSSDSEDEDEEYDNQAADLDQIVQLPDDDQSDDDSNSDSGPHGNPDMEEEDMGNLDDDVDENEMESTSSSAEDQSSDDEESTSSQNADQDSDGSNGHPDEVIILGAEIIYISDSGSDTDDMEPGHSPNRSDSERTNSQMEYDSQFFGEEPIEEGELVNGENVQVFDNDEVVGSDSIQVPVKQEISSEDDTNSTQSGVEIVPTGHRFILGNEIHEKKLERITAQKAIVNLTDEFAVTEADFEKLTLVGIGGYGHVFLARKLTGHDEGHLYAMKVISKLKSINTFKEAEHLMLERRILEQIQGLPFLVRLHYGFKTDANLFLVMDFVQGGELFRRLQTSKYFPAEYIPHYMAEVIVALHHLHQLGYMYRDLKLENVLIDSEGHIVLVDMGMARKLSATDRGHNICGTLDYMAPEMLSKCPEGYDEAVDWWSVGVLIYEILTGGWPFGNRREMTGPGEAAHAIMHMEAYFPDTMCPVAVSLLMGLLEKDPKERLRFEAIQLHPFFDDIDWMRLRAKEYEMPCESIFNGSTDVSHFDPIFTQQSLDVITSVAPPSDLQLYRGFDYVAPQHLEQGYGISCEGIPELRDDLILGEYVAKGAYGSCYVAENAAFVVKITHMCHFRLAEIEALKTFSHPNIVSYYGTFRQQCHIYIVMKGLFGGDLGETISTRLLYEDECRNIFVQLVKAVCHIHGNRFIHGDIKPENVVFSGKETVALVDFGNASYNKEFKRWQDKPRYTLEYAPPELLVDSKSVTYTPAVDIFGLGATLYAMIVAHSPYRKDSELVEPSAEFDNVLRERRNKTPEFNTTDGMWQSTNYVCRHLMAWCLETDPEDRPKLRDIIRHPWLMPYVGVGVYEECEPRKLRRSASMPSLPKSSFDSLE